MHEAAWRDDARAVELALERGAALDARTHEGHTALEIALARRCEEAAIALVQNGAEPTTFGQDALVGAAELGLPRLLEAIAAGPSGAQRLRVHGAAAWATLTGANGHRPQILGSSSDDRLFGGSSPDLGPGRARVMDWLREHGVPSSEAGG